MSIPSKHTYVDKIMKQCCCLAQNKYFPDLLSTSIHNETAPDKRRKNIFPYFSLPLFSLSLLYRVVVALPLISVLGIQYSSKARSRNGKRIGKLNKKHDNWKAATVWLSWNAVWFSCHQEHVCQFHVFLVTYVSQFYCNHIEFKMNRIEFSIYRLKSQCRWVKLFTLHVLAPTYIISLPIKSNSSVKCFKSNGTCNIVSSIVPRKEKPILHTQYLYLQMKIAFQYVRFTVYVIVNDM